jgi:hypothetical protein
MMEVVVCGVCFRVGNALALRVPFHRIHHHSVRQGTNFALVARDMLFSQGLNEKHNPFGPCPRAPGKSREWGYAFPRAQVRGLARLMEPRVNAILVLKMKGTYQVMKAMALHLRLVLGSSREPEQRQHP